MKSGEKAAAKSKVVALALTWDGARWPVRGLPAKARAFLAGASRKIAAPSVGRLTKVFAEGDVKEIRVCWVPRLKGGKKTLSDPFATAEGKRIAFKVVRWVRWGDVMGVVYRKIQAA